jgi:tetratricopeptide (TPR) repeat protein
MKRPLVFLLFLGLFFVEPFLASERIALQIEDTGPVSFTEFTLRFLGELRYTLASYLWLQTEIYHHELNLGVIRGSVGHGPPSVKEIIAICRLVTILDPHFIQAYDIGSWRLVQGLGDFKRGFAFLREGIANNPNSYLLYADMGDFYFLYLHDRKKAIPYLKKAYELSNNDYYPHLDTLRLLATCYETTGQKEKALSAWQEVLKIHPGDPAAIARIKVLTKKERSLRSLHNGQNTAP